MKTHKIAKFWSGRTPKQKKIDECTECDTYTAVRQNVWYVDYQGCIRVIKQIVKKAKCVIITGSKKNYVYFTSASTKIDILTAYYKV